MFGTPWPKLGLLIFLLMGIGILIVGGVQKLRDREVGWKWSAVVSQRHGRDPLGYGSARAPTLFLPQPRYGWLSR